MSTPRGRIFGVATRKTAGRAAFSLGARVWPALCFLTGMLPTLPDGAAPRRTDPLAPIARAVIRGDDRAVGVLVRATQPRLMRLAVRLTRDADAADDVVVTAFTRGIMAMRAGKFRFESSVASWLERIVTRGALDSLRQSRRMASRTVELDEQTPDQAPSPEDIVIARAGTRRVAELMAALPPRQREALSLVELDGLTPEAAAKELGCSRGAVELLLVRARRMLRTESAEVLGC